MHAYEYTCKCILPSFRLWPIPRAFASSRRFGAVKMRSMELSIESASTNPEFQDISASCTNRVSFASALTGRSAFIRCVRNPSANSTPGSPVTEHSGRLASTNLLRRSRKDQKNTQLNARRHQDEWQQSKTKHLYRADVRTHPSVRTGPTDHQP